MYFSPSLSFISFPSHLPSLSSFFLQSLPYTFHLSSFPPSAFSHSSLLSSHFPNSLGCKTLVIKCCSTVHILSVSLAGWPSQNTVNDLGSQGICISAGSACHQGKPSHVVAALKLPKRVAAGVIRLSFGPETTEAEIDACAQALRRHHDTRMPML